MGWTGVRLCARGSGVGMEVGKGIGMDRCPGSRSQSRSCSSQRYLQTTGIHGFNFDDTASNNGSVSTTANIDGGVAIPPSVHANGQGAGGAGTGEWAESVTRSLKMFSEGPPVVGYGGWTNVSRLASPQQQQHVRQIGEVVQRQHAVSSDEEQQ